MSLALYRVVVGLLWGCCWVVVGLLEMLTFTTFIITQRDFTFQAGRSKLTKIARQASKTFSSLIEKKTIDGFFLVYSQTRL